MLFVNEEAFEKDPGWGLRIPNDIREYSYFTETADTLLYQKFLHEGFFQDINTYITDYTKSHEYLIKNGIHKICNSHLVLMKDTVIDFANDFQNEYNANKKWFEVNAKDLKNYDGPDVGLSTNMYNYSNLSNDKVPSLDVLKDIDKQLRNTAVEVKKCPYPNEKATYFSILSETIYNDIHVEQYYDKARSETLDIKSPILPSKYPSEIFNTFRSGGLSRLDPFSAKEIKEIALRMEHYPKYIKDMRNTINEANSVYKSIADDSKKIEAASVSYLTDEALTKAFNNYEALNQERVHHVSEIYILALAGKFDAIAKSYLQDITVLRLAADNIKK